MTDGTHTFTIPGPAKGKPRHRMTRTGHAYSTKEGAAWENLVRLAYGASGGRRIPDGCAVSLQIEAQYHMPTSWPKWKREAMEWKPKTTKPDCDNILKGVKDALNGVAWGDDASVHWESAEKMYCPDWEDEKTTIAIHWERMPQTAKEYRAMQGDGK